MIDSLAIGRKIVGMQYYVPNPDWFMGPITFRIYKKGAYYFEDELLAEKVLPHEMIHNQGWYTVYFDEPIPLNGCRILAAVGFQQSQEGNPISRDEGPLQDYYSDLVRVDGEEWFSYSLLYGVQEFGDHNIRVICSGQPVDASWVHYYGTDEEYGGVMFPGTDEWLNLAFSSVGYAHGDYHATLVIETNNDENPVLRIPINMMVRGESIDENLTNKYNVYPNPANGIIYIDGEGLNCAVIYNSNGQMINVVRINDKTVTVNDLENGVYYLSIINDRGESAIEKIVIAR